MAFAKGIRCRLDVSATFAAAKAITAITLAYPGVATSAAHAMTAGTVGFFTVPQGMVELDGQAGRVYAPATDTFQIQSLSTRKYSAHTGAGVTFTPVATWMTLAEATAWDHGGGESEQLDTTCLIDAIKRSEAGSMSAQTLSIGVKRQTFNSAAGDLIESSAMDGLKLVFRLTYDDGSVRIVRGQPSVFKESVQVGAISTGGFNITPTGLILSGRV